MRVFVDTNIYLNFYRMSRETQTLLREFLNITKENKIDIIFPPQVKEEIIRNKGLVIDNFSSCYLQAMPIIVRAEILVGNFKDSKDAKKRKQRLDKRYRNIIEKYKKITLASNSKVNVLIKEIQRNSLASKETPDILQRAYFRYLKGNPPRKNKNDESFGDAIIWETILDSYINDDLSIITNDNDWFNCFNKSKRLELNDLLKQEWKNKSRNKIIIYKNLGQFVSGYEPKEKKVKREVLIEEERVASINTSVFTGISRDYINMNQLSPSGLIHSVDLINPAVVAMPTGHDINLSEAINISANSAFAFACPKCYHPYSSMAITGQQECSHCGFKE